MAVFVAQSLESMVSVKSCAYLVKRRGTGIVLVYPNIKRELRIFALPMSRPVRCNSNAIRTKSKIAKILQRLPNAKARNGSHTR